METMNLNDSGDGMVPLTYQPNVIPTQAPPPPPQQAPKAPEKNIPKQHITMDSTPIEDIMGPADTMIQQQQPMMAAPQAAMAASPAAKAAAAQQHKNPFGMTDEQYQALIAGVCAILAFSNPVQEKLLSAVPQFMAEGGVRSTSGLIATGLIAAIIFYFAQRFIMRA